MNLQFNKGDRVQWMDGSSGRHICVGTIINEEKYPNGTNPFGHWNIEVDKEYRLKACYSSKECTSGHVTRSVVFNKLRLEGS